MAASILPSCSHKEGARVRSRRRCSSSSLDLGCPAPKTSSSKPLLFESSQSMAFVLAVWRAYDTRSPLTCYWIVSLYIWGTWQLLSTLCWLYEDYSLHSQMVAERDSKRKENQLCLHSLSGSPFSWLPLFLRSRLKGLKRYDQWHRSGRLPLLRSWDDDHLVGHLSV